MKAAILGAGIAGLTAARELAGHGVEVTVFEKSRGVGGRLANKRLDWGTVDIGAQYFTARDPRFQKQVELWQELGVVARWPFNPHSLTATGLTTRPDSTPRFIGTPKMNSLAHALAKGLDVQLNTRIESLEHTATGWVLTTANGTTLPTRYDWVVLSLPAEQSNVLLPGTAIAQQLPKQTHEPCWALALATRGQVPAEIQGIFGDEIVSWVSRLSAHPERSVPQQALGKYDDLWMLHFSSDWSSTHTQDTQVDVAQVGLQWLSQALDAHIEQPLQLVHDFKHYWRYARLENNIATPAVIADRSTGIAAIGAWTAGGRVEGGYVSALDFIDYFLSTDN